MVAPSAAGVSDAAQRQGSALGAAGGEYDLLGLAAQEIGDAAAGAVQSLAGLLGLSVEAGGVAPEVGQVGEHRLQDAGVQGRRGRVV